MASLDFDMLIGITGIQMALLSQVREIALLG